jgi:hypothetical protein
MEIGAIAQQIRRLEREAEFSSHLMPKLRKSEFLSPLCLVLMMHAGKADFSDTTRHNLVT